MKVYMGNELMALAAINAGVGVVTGYPGTPSTEVLENVAKYNTENKVYVEWSVNEKVALEVAAGAAVSGARALCTMKQMGLNVAADPLMCLSYLGIKGGLVILAADDPGPISSQTEQDTRSFARHANLPVFDPSDAQEAYDMMICAFEFSEKMGIPCIIRPTTRVCHSAVSLEVPPMKELNLKQPTFIKDKSWVIFPSLSYKNHIALEKKQTEMGQKFSKISFNSLTGYGNKAIATSGVCYTRVCEALTNLHIEAKVLKVGCAYPYPRELYHSFLENVDSVLCIEELDAFIEQSLNEVYSECDTRAIVYGKQTGNLPPAGEYSYEIVYNAIAEFFNKPQLTIAPPVTLPVRPPVLCNGCPHRASFLAVKEGLADMDCVFCGDIGCYTLGNADPINMVDTCLCMGGGITMAQGILRADRSKKTVAFIGDSTFFHSGITGVLNAVYNQADILIVVLDNHTTAMTGQQPHPGTGRTMMNAEVKKADIAGILGALGVSHVEKVNPFSKENAVGAVKNAANVTGVSCIVFESPCISLK